MEKSSVYVQNPNGTIEKYEAESQVEEIDFDKEFEEKWHYKIVRKKNPKVLSPKFEKYFVTASLRDVHAYPDARYIFAGIPYTEESKEDIEHLMILAKNKTERGVVDLMSIMKKYVESGLMFKFEFTLKEARNVGEHVEVCEE